MRQGTVSIRQNALWGRGGRGEGRSNALWGRGGRTSIALAVAGAALVAAAGANAGGGSSSAQSVYVPDSLTSAIAQNPKQSFDVILQGDPTGRSRGLLAKILSDSSGAAGDRLSAADVTAVYSSIDGVHATLTGRKLQHLIQHGLVDSIVPNEPVRLSGVGNGQVWPWAVGAPADWSKGSPAAPTIAIVDSGIDASRPDVAGRVVEQVNLSSLTPAATGDGYGHGTFVAGIAAGSAPGYMGVVPRANLVSIRVMDDHGMATVGDVINACDWILANKAAYNIRVANFSLHAVNRASILFDPLDRAVEKLWLNGVVVVAASGNYGTPDGPSGVPFAPGNDPFVITVGAADVGARVSGGDDRVAPWSAWGYTPDGFMKPDLGAPGRYMVGPVSPGAFLYTSRPDSVVAPGYMQLSGTSFAAPVVAGAAASMLANHPGWTPDQVKATLLLAATPETSVPAGALGVGDVSIVKARGLNPTSFPNPNAGLEAFVTTGADGTPVFDGAAWQSAALSNAAWGSAAWSSAAWSSAAWSSAAWSSVAWSSAAWSSAAYGTAAWSSVAWSDVAWSDAAKADGTEADASPGADATAASGDYLAAAAALLGVDPSCDPAVADCALDTGAVPTAP